MLALGLGEAPGELIQVAGGDQLPLGGVIAWRQCPVVPGGLAVPNPPLRVLAPEPLKSTVPVVRAVTGGHRWWPFLAAGVPLAAWQLMVASGGAPGAP